MRINDIPVFCFYDLQSFHYIIKFLTLEWGKSLEWFKETKRMEGKGKIKGRGQQGKRGRGGERKG